MDMPMTAATLRAELRCLKAAATKAAQAEALRLIWCARNERGIHGRTAVKMKAEVREWEVGR